MGGSAVRLAVALIVVVLVAGEVVPSRRPPSTNVVAGLLERACATLSLGTNGLFSTPTSPTVGPVLDTAVAVVTWLGILLISEVLIRAPARLERRGRPADGAEGPDAARRAIPVASRVIFLTVAVVATIEATAFSATYFLYSRHYVTTDNAKADGDKVGINAPASGAVQDWAIDQGSTVRTDQVVGRIRPVGGGGQPERIVRSPGTGTVAVNDVVNGSFVAAGTELATAYDLSRVYVTARVAETDIDGVRPGAPVDIEVDAFPGVPVAGVVAVVQDSAAGNFTVYPPNGTADPSNPQRVDQYIPVKIILTGTGGVVVRPGMSVTVHIRTP
ncbi:MAG TPA: efflux RND transporter periplasmic adaptor subunit [Pseudonocardia sp.]|jgi:hypothetical protein|nr:efflux RND transporter periplasmic adaptor subunit [Pseudonocardia sp.]